MNLQNSSEQSHKDGMTPSSCGVALLQSMRSEEVKEDSEIVISSAQANQDDIDNRKITHCLPTEVSELSQEQISSRLAEEWEIVARPTIVEENTTTTGIIKTTENDADTSVILDLLNTLINQCVELEKNSEETNDLDQDTIIVEAIVREEGGEVSTPIVLVSDTSSVCSSNTQQHQTQMTRVDNTFEAKADVLNKEMKNSSNSKLSETSVSDEIPNASFNEQEALKDCNEELNTCNPTNQKGLLTISEQENDAREKTFIDSSDDESYTNDNSRDVCERKKKKLGKGTAFTEKEWIAYLTVCHDHVKKHGKCTRGQLSKATAISPTSAFKVIFLYKNGFIPCWNGKINSLTRKTAKAAYKEFAAKYNIRSNQSKVSAKKSSKALSSTAHKNDECRKLKRKRSLIDETSKQSRNKKSRKKLTKDEWLDLLKKYRKMKHGSNECTIPQLASSANAKREIARRAINLYNYGYIKECPNNQNAIEAYKEFAAKHNIRSNQSKVSAKKSSQASSSTAHKNDECRKLERKRSSIDETSKQSRNKKSRRWLTTDEWLDLLEKYHKMKHGSNGCTIAQLASSANKKSKTATRAINLYNYGYIKDRPNNQNAIEAYKEFAAKHNIRSNQSKVSAKKLSKALSSTAHKNDECRKLKRKRSLIDETSKQSRNKKSRKRHTKDEVTLTKRTSKTSSSTAPKNNYFQQQTTKTNPHPQKKKWLKPTQEIFNTKDRKRVFVVENCIHVTLELKKSIIPSTEEGVFLSYEGNDEYWEVPAQGVDLGAYASHTSEDLKQPIIFEIKNFLFGWVLQEWSLQAHDNCFWDITDTNGKVHDEANKTLLPKVNEVYEKSSKLKQNVDIDFDNKKRPHYILLGGTKFERGVPKELFTHCGPEYNQVRKRKYSALGERDSSWVPAYSQISRSIDAYQEKDVFAVLDYFLHFTPTDSEARYRMKWATEEIQRICLEVLYRSGRKLPKAMETKIEKVLSLFPRPKHKHKDDQKTITNNKNVGCIVVRQVVESGTFESGMVEHQLANGNYVISMTSDLSLKEWKEEEVLRGKK